MQVLSQRVQVGPEGLHFRMPPPPPVVPLLLVPRPPLEHLWSRRQAPELRSQELAR